MPASPVASRYLTIACFLTAAFLFFVADRAAYRGYFSADDLDTLRWAPTLGLESFFGQLATPIYSAPNMRPIGFLFYRAASRAFGQHFAPYVVMVQLFHALNAGMLFLLLRRLLFDDLAAGAGALFYAFNATVMEAYWKPMFVFDVLCAAFCLLTLLLYVRGRWLLALIPFWLAYKSKEIAVMLPAGLVAYEFFLGQRKWKRVLPFLLISLSFGLQALWLNRSTPLDNAYALRFAPDAFMKALGFYSAAIFILPPLGLTLLLLPWLVRDRRLYFGGIIMASVLIPLVSLPNRLLSVYWYVPMIGLAIAVAAVAARAPRWAAALFFLVWLPWNYYLVREKRRIILADADRTRQLVVSLQDYARSIPPVRAIVYDNLLNHVDALTISGAVSLAFGPTVEAVWSGSPVAKDALAMVPMALLTLYPPPAKIKGLVRMNDEPESYVRFQDRVVETQFGAGWYDSGSRLRWIAPRAEASFYRPAGATQFEIMAFVPGWSLQQAGPERVTLYEDDQSLGTVVYSEPRPQPLRWKLPASSAGRKRITIVSTPVRHGGTDDPRDLAISITAVGYVLGP